MKLILIALMLTLLSCTESEDPAPKEKPAPKTQETGTPPGDPPNPDGN